MQSTPKSQAIRAKEIVLSYLQGEPVSVVKVHLQNECEELNISSRAIYEAIEVNMELAEQDEFLSAILGSLNLKLTDTYCKQLIGSSKNLYTLLNHLHQDGNHQIGTFLKQIEATSPPRNRVPVFLGGAVLSATLGLFFYFKKHAFDILIKHVQEWLPSATHWIGKTFSLLRNIPLLGLIYQGLVLLHTSWSALFKGTHPITKRLTALLHHSIPPALVMTGYLLSYLAGGVMTLPAALLFVAGSGYLVFSSLTILFRARRTLNTLQAPADNVPWEAQAEYIRAQNLHQRSIPKFTTRLITAILATLAVAIWAFFPPNLILTAIIISFKTLIELTQQSILTGIDAQYANQLQKDLGEIKAALTAKISPEGRSRFATYAQKETYLNTRTQLLSAKEGELQQRSRILQMKEEIISTTPLQVFSDRLDQVTLAIQQLNADHGTTMRILSQLQQSHAEAAARAAHSQSAEQQELAPLEDAMSIGTGGALPLLSASNMQHSANDTPYRLANLSFLEEQSASQKADGTGDSADQSTPGFDASSLLQASTPG